MPQSNAPFALAATCMVLVGCYEPPLLSRGDQALAAGKYSEALSIYRAAESDDALDRASLAKRQTEAALGFLDDKLEPIKAKPAEEALAELKGILDQREFATPALADRIRQAMTEVVEKAWPAIEADLKPGRFPHAIERAAKLMAGVPQDHPTRQRFLDARAAAASYLVTRASQLGKEHVILRRALLGLASAYGAPGGLGEIDRELEKRFGYSVQVTLASTACEAASHALQSELQRAGAPGGAGVVTVALSVSTCNPERKESTEEKTVTWEEWKRVTVIERRRVEHLTPHTAVGQATNCYGEHPNRTCNTTGYEKTTYVTTYTYVDEPVVKVVAETKSGRGKFTTVTKSVSIRGDAVISFEGRRASVAIAGSHSWSGLGFTTPKEFQDVPPEPPDDTMYRGAGTVSLKNIHEGIASLVLESQLVQANKEVEALPATATDLDRDEIRARSWFIRKGAATDGVKLFAEEGIDPGALYRAYWLRSVTAATERQIAGERLELPPVREVKGDRESAELMDRLRPVGRGTDARGPEFLAYKNLEQSVGYGHSLLRKDADASRMHTSIGFAGGGTSAVRAVVDLELSKFKGSSDGVSAGLVYQMQAGEFRDHTGAMLGFGVVGGVETIVDQLPKESHLRLPVSVEYGIGAGPFVVGVGARVAPNLLSLFSKSDDRLKHVSPLGADVSIYFHRYAFLRGSLTVPLGADEAAPRLSADLGLRL